MKFVTFLLLTFTFSQLPLPSPLSWMGAGTAMAAKKRYQGKPGNKAPGCPNYPRPPICNVAKAKTAIYVQSSLCTILKQNSKCYYTIGYRSCRTNSSIRGAARRSAHLCGLAADIRLGTCRLGEFHGQGSAKHRHYQIGSCQ